jgi:1-acyl-sn-glycerol-3-phosphate acyltransferase
MRRWVSVSAVGLACLFVFAATPLLLPLLAIVDVVRDRRMPLCRAWVWLAGVLVAEVVGVVIALVSTGASDLEGSSYRLQRSWSRALIAWTGWVYGLRVEHTGPTLDEGRFLLLPRHASLADTLLPMWVTDGRAPLRPRYVLKKELQWDPCLDIVGSRVPNVFVDRSGVEGEVGRVAALADDLGPRDFVVLFPEGTRFSAARRDRVLKRLRERGQHDRLAAAERLENVLPLRAGGTIGLLARQPLDVVLMAHTGLEGTRTLGDVLRGDLIGRTIRVHTRRVPGSQIPGEEAALRAWLDDSWAWVDRAVGSMRDAA